MTLSRIALLYLALGLAYAVGCESDTSGVESESEAEAEAEAEAESEAEAEAEAEAESEAEAEAEAEAEGECDDDERRCSLTDDSVYQHCVAGSWEDEGTCEGACFEGACETSECPDSAESRCTDEGTIETCEPAIGGWSLPDDCAIGFVCDPTMGSSCVEIICAPGVPICIDEGTTGTCSDYGTGVAVGSTCADNEVCVVGACSTVCALSDALASFYGCTFYPLDTDNGSHDDGLLVDLLLTNPDPTVSVSATLEIRVAPESWTTIATGVVDPGEVQIFQPSDRHVEDTALSDYSAWRLRSDFPIVAFMVNSNDQDGSSWSSSGTLLLPRSGLDIEHYGVTVGQNSSNRGWVAVVGTEDATDVTITVTDSTVAGSGVPAMLAGDTITVTLDETDVLQIASDAAGDDLSGTHVVASAPIAFYSGHECATISGATCTADAQGGDHMAEQLPAVVTWGREFVAAKVWSSELSLASQLVTSWKIVGSADGTTVTFSGTAGLSGVPASLSLDQGDVATLAVTGTTTNPGHFYISADQPIQVAQIMHGELALILTVPVEQYRANYVFLTPSYAWFEDGLFIVRETGAAVDFNGGPPVGTWIPAGTDHEVMALLEEFGDFVDGTHAVSSGSSTPGVYLMGRDGNCSYGFPGGLNLERINQ